MDEYSLNPAGDDLDDEAPETPEDVAVLYTWANVHGGKYRDFSASRREFRAQQRHRAVEQQRQAELEAARAREEAAAQEMARVQQLEQEASQDERLREEADEARRRAEENIEQERQAAQHHVAVAESLKRALEEAQQEMEEARRRAEEQAARYAEADARYRASARSQALPGEIEDPYYYAGPLEPTAFAPGRGVRSSVPQRTSSERRITESYYRSKGSSEAGYRAQDSSAGRASSRDGAGSSAADGESYREQPHGSPVQPEGPQAFTGAHTDTPEDAFERNRPDELERLRSRVDHGNRDREEDSYYHQATGSQPRPSDPSALNSAPSNTYLPPRIQQAPVPPRPSREELATRSEARRRDESRPSHEIAERHVNSSDDPAPGSPHGLDQIRARRRESTADVQARTARAPRESGALYPPMDSGEDSRMARLKAREDAGAAQQVSATTPRVSSPQPFRDDQPVSSATTPSESPLRRLQQTEAPRERRPNSLAGPEWLVSESSGGDGHPMDSRNGVQQRDSHDERSHGAGSVPRQAERRARPRDSHRIPAEDGGFNLPPLRDSFGDRFLRSASAARGQSSYREEASLPAEASPRHTDRTARPEPPPVVLTTNPDPVPMRPSAERRRSERSSSDRLSRDLRVPATDATRLDLNTRSVRAPERQDTTGARPADTLQQSRERVAARWFALKGLVGGSGETPVEPAAARSPQREMPLPILAVVSLSGGVGKTSMVATVGRALSAVGERVLLADTTPHTLLPYYFGARELRPDVVRTFSPPPGSGDATVFMVNYEAELLNGDDVGQTALIEEMGRHVKGAQRLLLDLNGTSAWLARRLAGMNSTILVPIAADMNSVLGIKSVERFFAGLQDSDGRPQLPYYILNQFDASLPLHLDVREVLRQQLGDRLLPVMIRRSPSVAEALAEGMTVVDYAPASPVTEDYLHLAEWVRQRSAPAQTVPRSTRWSEQ